MKARTLFKRELRLAFQQGWSAQLAFFLIVILSFMLASEQSLAPLAQGLIWAALLLAHLLILPRFFDDDIAYGVLEVMLVEIELPIIIILTKALALWVGAILPMIALIPVSALMLELDPIKWLPLISTTFIGSLGLVFLGCFAAALTSGLRAAPWLAPLIVIPLELPLLIFGAAASRLAWNQFFVSPPNLLLIGLVLFACVFAPWLALLALNTLEK